MNPLAHKIDRNNNFNFIRICAAMAVLVSHSFTIVGSANQPEPLQKIVGMTLGSIAVDIFFVTSGFLVTGSLLNGRSSCQYLLARALRIFPALIAMLLATTLLLGAWFTTLPLTTYYSSKDVYWYLLKGSTLFWDIEHYLPGVFTNNPYRRSVNESLWTLPYEVRMYGILLLIFWVSAGFTKLSNSWTMKHAIGLCALIGGGLYIYDPISGNFFRFFYMFFSGSALYLIKGRSNLSGKFVVLLLLTLVISFFLEKNAFSMLYGVALPYVLIYLAFLPAEFPRRFELMGDYSYGTYIYAFPVQQSIVASIPGISVGKMIFCSAITTLILAGLSWHLLEKRALHLKRQILDGQND